MTTDHHFYLWMHSIDVARVKGEIKAIATVPQSLKQEDITE